VATSTRRHGTRWKLLAGASVSLTLFAVAEGVARSVEAVGTRAQPAAPPASDSFREALVDLGGFDGANRLLESDPELMWALRPDVHGLASCPPLWLDVRTNALGYRDPPRDWTAPSGALRLLCLGDSCTYGVGVRLADAWPQQLEALLAGAYSDRAVEVWNGGVPGWTSDQGRTKLARDGARVAPRIVTICFGVNDALHRDNLHHKERGHARCVADRAVREQLDAPLARFDRVLSHCALYRELARLVPTSDEAKVEHVDQLVHGGPRVPLADYVDNVESMVAQARALHARPVLVVWPIRWQLERRPDDPARELDPPTPIQLATRELGPRLGVPVLDLLASFAGEHDLYVDSVHLNAAGCHRVADELARFLYDQKLLPEPPPTKAR
jgi:lysophospholipase L1-like esterase